jgi:predicted ATPase with chaperone activity
LLKQLNRKREGELALRDIIRVDYEKLSKEWLGESSAEILQRVETAGQVQRERFADSPAVACNADMRIAEVLQYRPELMVV